MLLQYKSSILNFFLLTDNDDTNNKIPNWRISALRIILSTVMLVCLAVVCHTFGPAVQLSLIHIIILSVSFFSIVITLLIASYKYYKFCAHFFLITTVLASLAINLFITDLELAKVGSMYMFACPTIALILLGYRSAICYALLNLAPFFMIIYNVDLSILFSPPEQLPNTNWYIMGVIFAFYNICIPLAVARTSVAAKRLNQSIQDSNTHLTAKNELYRTFFSHYYKPKVILSEKGEIIDLNEQAKILFTIELNTQTTNEHLSTLLPKLTSNDHKDQLIQIKDSYHRVTKQNVVNSTYTVYEFSDCTQEHKIKKNLISIEEKYKRLRYTDSQTNLPNKDWFERQCESLAIKKSAGFYIIVIQSANNDYVNLKFGESDFRTLTIAAYKRITDNIKEILLCSDAGLGKLVFLINTPNVEELEKLLSRIKKTLDAEYTLFNSTFTQSYLFGIAQFSQENNSSAKVIANAQEALKSADNINVFSYYNQESSQLFLKKHEISMLLDEAIQSAALDVYYQPKVTKDGLCIGLEALARWNSPVLGVVPPDTFIPVAEEYRLICPLTNLIIQKVCAQIQKWNQSGFDVVPIAINLSPFDFNQKDFVSNLIRYLADFNVKPDQIELEITETALEENNTNALKIIQSLQSWGFIISIDDFGTGYSNIARLADYPINKLKLDRSLTNMITTSKRHYNLVKAVHAMCRSLNIKCVSEGIEKREYIASLADMGSEEFQGYYFARPMTASDFYLYTQQNGLFFNGEKVENLPS
ncbi:GGDEF domain-containing phosphodiesterase [Colwellia sp. C2M11]|uniref:putative bifunctional diguanylate cyclase/phosphodiesterase n=1 Tax=unclassified Colwellia TaxID=196834 RepID=UPI00339D75B3